MICAYEECKKEFTPKTHNQKYCSDECCRIATNKKLKEQYYEKKARLAGAIRICKTKDCGTTLSRYSSNKVCNACDAEKRGKDRKELLEMIRSVSSQPSKK